MKKPLELLELEELLESMLLDELLELYKKLELELLDETLIFNYPTPGFYLHQS